MTASSATSSNRLPWLDVLRGLAALAVVIFHVQVIARHYYPPDSALWASAPARCFMQVARWGVLGVTCFFVLSGFCVGQTWQRSKSASQFGLRRWRRIFPPYYASLVLVLACVIITKLITGVNDITTLPPPSPGNVLATLTLMTAPASQTPTLAWVYWTLSYEVIFYVVLTLLLLLPASMRLGALALVNTAICLLGMWRAQGWSPGALFFVDLWPLFGLGLALTLSTQSRAVAVVVGVMSFAAVIHLAVANVYPNFAWAGMVATALVAASDSKLPFSPFQPLETLGEFSYSLYLTHVPVLLALGKHLVLRPQATPLGFFAGTVAAVCLMIVAAFAFYTWFERPYTTRSAKPAMVPA